MTPEHKVKQIIKSLLDQYQENLYYYMPVPNGYGAATLDYLGCFHGFGFAIEAKTLGKKPTPRQLGTIEDMHAAGMPVFVIDGSPPGLDALERWLKMIRVVAATPSP